MEFVGVARDLSPPPILPVCDSEFKMGPWPRPFNLLSLRVPANIFNVDGATVRYISLHLKSKRNSTSSCSTNN